MENQGPAQRLFTRADVERLVVNAFGKTEGCTYTIESINLLPGLTPPAWIVYYVFVYNAETLREYSYRNSFIVTQRLGYDKPYLYFCVEDELPEGMSTPAEEDAEIARRKAEKHAAWLRRQAQNEASTSSY